ncbi:hypothetical protein [Lentibacillus sp. Marseille-P4043]|uniref:hypothetical protein n=1 Tax=Lentibacillus sp. Marseille-P4043 TaxID=2040293 RepID=UPI000D0B92F7|nr:hypothetical protein [Lentibacillus sp. Marseille-P4043]
MQEWKQAFQLATFELKASKQGFLFLALFFVLVLVFLTVELRTYIEQNFAGLDLAFILTFSGLIMIWLKPKNFQLTKLNEDVTASPSLIMLNQLPITKDVIMKSRFIVHFFYSFPFQFLLLIGLYPLSPNLQDALSIGSYIAFSIIWLSFSFYAGYIFPAADAGTKNTNTVLSFILGFIFAIGAMFVFAIIQVATGHAIVYWTIIFAQTWPLLSSFLSVILAFIGFTYWQHYTRKTIDKLDYL